MTDLLIEKKPQFHGDDDNVGGDDCDDDSEDGFLGQLTNI